MEEEWTQTMGTAPLLAIAVGSIALILLLVIRFKVHAFIALIAVSVITAIAAGVPMEAVMDVLEDGFGGTLAGVALLVALGAMLGRLVEHSGGAQALADTMVAKFGAKRAPFALGIASLLLGFPMFMDAGLVMFLPIVFAVARRISDKSVLLFGIPAAAGFSVMHVFLPPHPGPVSAAEFYEANVGMVMLIGLIIAFPLWYLVGYLWGRFVGERIILPVPAIFGERDYDLPSNPPKVMTIIGLLLTPMFLILLNTGLSTLVTAGVLAEGETWTEALIFLGNSGIALLITVALATIVLGYRRGETGTALEKLVDSALGPVASVILITGAGGMFGSVLNASGIGEAVAGSLSDTGMPVILSAYLIALVMRVAQGSATVALVTAAGLASSAVTGGDFNEVQVACIVLATAAGSVFAGHVNDSGFWLVGRLMGMDVQTTLKTWTVQQSIQSVVGFGLVYAVYMAAAPF